MRCARIQDVFYQRCISATALSEDAKGPSGKSCGGGTARGSVLSHRVRRRRQLADRCRRLVPAAAPRRNPPRRRDLFGRRVPGAACRWRRRAARRRSGSACGTTDRASATTPRADSWRRSRRAVRVRVAAQDAPAAASARGRRACREGGERERLTSRASPSTCSRSPAQPGRRRDCSRAAAVQIAGDARVAGGRVARRRVARSNCWRRRPRCARLRRRNLVVPPGRRWAARGRREISPAWTSARFTGSLQRVHGC